MAIVYFILFVALPIYSITWLVCNSGRTVASDEARKRYWKDVEAGSYGKPPAKWRIRLTKAIEVLVP